MPLTLKISQGTIDIPIEKYKGIALAVSGGIDSATLLYIMSEYIHENNLNTQIYALTVPNKILKGINISSATKILTAKSPNDRVNQGTPVA